MKAETQQYQIGDVFKSRDPREKGREVTLVSRKGEKAAGPYGKTVISPLWSCRANDGKISFITEHTLRTRWEKITSP